MKGVLHVQHLPAAVTALLWSPDGCHLAAAVDLSVGAWSLALSAALGLVTGLAIRSTGLLFTFGCLVLPALVAKNLCHRVQPMFLVAPVVGVAAVLLGLLLAHRFDFPPGQLIVAMLTSALALAWVWREVRQWIDGVITPTDFAKPRQLNQHTKT